MSDNMRFTSGISDAVNAVDAAKAAAQQALDQLAGQSVDLACIFASPIYQASWPDVLSAIHDKLHPKVLIGCSGSGIIGGTQELEWVPAISVTAAHLPQVKLYPFVIAPDELETSTPGGFWIDKIGVSPEAHPVFVAVIDPYTSDPRKLVSELSATYKGAPIIGGLVSGGSEPGQQLAFMDTTVYREGAVGVAMAGNIKMDTVISQSCRPIGRPWIITKAEDNVIYELAGRQALGVLHEVLSTLSADDRELAQQGSVFIGLVYDEMRAKFASGDFLVRNLVGIDPNQGAIAVSDHVEVGHTLQFQLRDPSTSRQELRRLLNQVNQLPHVQPPVGCLLFNCTGRGKSLYGTANHDIRTIQMISGKLPVGGFFCNGEIGPIGGINLLHGYTASLGLFSPLTLPSAFNP